MSFLQALKSSIELMKIKIYFDFYPKGTINDDYFSIKNPDYEKFLNDI